MLKLSIFEFFFRGIPEEFLVMFSIYVFSLKKIDAKKLIISGFIFGILVYLIRLLPIQPGVHTLILIPVMVLISTIINKIPLIKAISASILSVIIMYICEMINSLILIYVLRLNIEIAFENIFVKVGCFSISLILYLLFCLIIYFLVYKKRIR